MNDGTLISTDQQEGAYHELFRVGELIDKTYMVSALLGRGGMGSVYRAEHVILKKDFAVKALNRQIVSGEVWQRFQNEARVLARLNHENIVAVQNSGVSARGIPYYVMDLLTGNSLMQMLKSRGRLPVAEVLPLFRQVCDGLSYAHDKGVIHRDIKPDNIMLEGKTVKLVDFGLAKALAEGQDQTLTREGHIFGSPPYMSPEQSAGGVVDHRSDIYSVGCSLYEALTGRPPYLGESSTATIMMHHNEPIPRLSQASKDPEFPERLEEIVAKMLAKEKKDRYQSLSKVATELREIELSLKESATIDEEVRPHKGQARHSSKWLLAAVVLLVVGIAALITYLSLAAKKSPAPRLINSAKAPTVETLARSDLSGESPLADQCFVASELKEIHKFNNGKPEDGSGHITLTFPKSASLGEITSFGSGAEQLAEAKGIISFTKRAKIEFTPNKLFLKDPANFRKFQYGDFTELNLTGYKGDLQDILLEISAIKSIKVFRLNQANLQDADIKLLDRLPLLDKLEMAGTKVTDQYLAKTSFLQRLRFLKISNLAPGSKTLAALRSSKHLTSLHVLNSTLSMADWKAIASLKNLECLDLTDSNLDDAALAQLTALSRLTEIETTRTKITPASISSFKKFAKLNDIKDDYTNWTSAQETDFTRALEPRRVTIGTDKMFK